MEDENLTEELASFRKEWKEELNSRENASGRQSPNVSTELKTNRTHAKVQQVKEPAKTDQSRPVCNTQTSSSLKENDDVVGGIKLPQLEDEEDGIGIKEKAEKFFRKGVSLEKNGLVYEALKFYRKAVQLVPDIEFTITDLSTSSDDEDYDDDDDYVIKNTSLNIPGISSLVHGIHNLSLSGFHLCEKEFESRATHISDIPVELLMYIFKWAVSTSLDFKSLEQVSMVCKGFYVCARDMELWKLGCQRMWGINCGSPIQWDDSWRLMFINRPHLWTQGIYISKTAYMRPSEKVEDIWSMQLVTYYRYMRFLNDGAVHVVTTPDEPQIVVPRFSQPGLPMMQGHYKILGNKVVIMLDVDSPIDSHYRARKGKRMSHSKLLENTFRMELEIRSTSRRRRHNQLTWVRYSHRKTYRDTGQTVVSEFDITSQFPPFSYSPVRSYTQTSLAPLV